MQAQPSAAYGKYEWPEITEDTKADYEGAIRDWVSYAEKQRGLADAWQARALELQQRLALFEGAMAPPPPSPVPTSTAPTTLHSVAPMSITPASEGVATAPAAPASVAFAPVATSMAAASAPAPVPFLGGGAHLPTFQAPAARAAAAAAVKRTPDRQELLRSFYRENSIDVVNGEYILHHPNGTRTNLGRALPLPFKELWIKHQQSYQP